MTHMGMVDKSSMGFIIIEKTTIGGGTMNLFPL